MVLAVGNGAKNHLLEFRDRLGAGTGGFWVLFLKDAVVLGAGFGSSTLWGGGFGERKFLLLFLLSAALGLLVEGPS